MAKQIQKLETIVARKERQIADDQTELETTNAKIRPLWLEAESEGPDARAAGNTADKLERRCEKLRIQIAKAKAVIEDAKAEIARLKKEEAEAQRHQAIKTAEQIHFHNIEHSAEFIENLKKAVASWRALQSGIDDQRKALAKAGLGSKIPQLFDDKPRGRSLRFILLSVARDLAEELGIRRYTGVKPDWLGVVSKLNLEDTSSWYELPTDAEVRARNNTSRVMTDEELRASTGGV